MRIARLLKAAALLAAITLTPLTPPVRAAVPDISTTDGQIIATLFERGLLSNEFNDEVLAIADQYTRRTRLAAQIRINRPTAPDALNIYVFWSPERFPRDSLVRNTCTAFPSTRVVICDHDFLDSIPSTMPVVLEEGQTELPAPALMFWVLGHEIGHILLNHRTAGFGQPNKETSGPDQTPGASKSVLEEESEADIFAMTGLPVSRQEEWIYFGNPLVDALLWEVGKLKLPEAQPSNATLVKIKLAPDHHPPLLKRLYDLVATIRRTFSTFPFGDGFIRPLQFQIEEGDPNEFAAPFYDGFYVRSATTDEVRARELLDLATTYSLHGGNELGDLGQKKACSGKVGASAIWALQQNLVCRAALPQDAAKYLLKCDTLQRDEGVRCYALISLVDLACATDRKVKQLEAICGRTTEIRAADKRYEGHGFEVPDDFTELRPWFLVARYRQYRDAHKLDLDSLEAWLRGVGQDPALGGDRSTMMELLTDHARYLAESHPDDWQRLANHYALISRYSEYVGNDHRALGSQKQVVDLLKSKDADGAILGFHLQRLASLMRVFQTPQIGSTEALTAAVHSIDLLRALEDGSTIRAQSGAVAEEAAEAYLQAVKRAHEQGDMKGELLFQQSYLNSLGSAVYSYNMSLDLKKALITAERLTRELDERPALRKEDGFDTKVLAPAFENTSQAFTAAPEGSAKLAVAQASEAVLIRERNNEDPSLALRILAYALYKSSKYAEAGAAAKRMITLFETATNRKYPVDGGSMISGKVVKLSVILAYSGR